MLVPRLPSEEVEVGQESSVVSSALLQTEVTLPVNDDGNGEKASLGMRVNARAAVVKKPSLTIMIFVGFRLALLPFVSCLIKISGFSLFLRVTL